MKPFDWHEYRKLAEELSTRPDPAAHRSAISGAYYAAFHVAAALPRRRQIPLGKANVHKEVIE